MYVCGEKLCVCVWDTVANPIIDRVASIACATQASNTHDQWNGQD